MEEEAWDETLMGPREGDAMQRVLQTGDTSVNPNPHLLRRTSSSGHPPSSAPPSSMFLQAIQHATPPPNNTTNSVLAPPVAASSLSSARRSPTMRFEDEDDEEEDIVGPIPTTTTTTPSTSKSSSPSSTPSRLESRRIRQEALRMLEVADDQLADSTYSVYRTSTGGFAATPKTDPPKQRRAPSAVSGLSVATARTNVARPFRDDPYADTEAPVAPTQEDYEYGDTSVLDVSRMEHRSAASRQAAATAASATRDAPGSKNNWSSRYSIDTTLLALSGGSVSSSSNSNRKLLDRMDQESSSDSRRTALNMFSSSPSETRSPQVFGSGFSFRQKHVFGQQQILATSTPPKSEPNLAFAREEEVEEAVAPARSWQEQFQQQRRHRRILFAAIASVVFCLIVVVALLAKHSKNDNGNTSESTVSQGPGVVSDAPEDPSVTFYVTSDVPLTTGREGSWVQDLKSLSSVASFLVHLGDIQDADQTACPLSQYTKVSNLLQQSPLPVFVVPGEDDWMNCPNQEAAWSNWERTFLQFERHFPHDFQVLRYDRLKENFALVHKSVLFVGIHETNGRIEDLSELNSRNHKNVEWIKNNFEYFRTDIRAMVILGNGKPELRQNDPFYLGLGQFLYEHKIPTAYIHANHGNGDEETKAGEYLEYNPFEIDGMDHVTAIQTSSGETSKPLRINVGFDEINPFVVG